LSLPLFGLILLYIRNPCSMLTSSLSEVLSEVSQHTASRRLVFCDEGFVQVLRWRGLADDLNSSACMLVPLHDLSPYERDFLRLFRPDEVVFLVSSPLKQAYTHILHATNVCREESDVARSPCRVLVLTTSSPQALAGTDDASPKAAYRELQMLLSPGDPQAIRVLYFPLHSFPVAPSSASSSASAVQPSVDAFVLGSASCRQFFPLSLTRLRMWKHVDDAADEARGKPQPCIHNIDVEHIPACTRACMRVLAHELAGALVFGHHLDCTSHMFSVGKTADFIGHTMQPVLEHLLRDRAAALEPVQQPQRAGLKAALQLSEGGVLLYGQHLTPDGDGRSAQKASLLLVDRVCDLVTPAVHTAAAPLAHRIVNALQRQREATAAGSEERRNRGAPLCDLRPTQTATGVAASMLDVSSAYAQTVVSSSGGEEHAISELCQALRAVAAEVGTDSAPTAGRGIADAERLLSGILQHVNTRGAVASAAARLRHSTLFSNAASAICAYKMSTHAAVDEGGEGEILRFRVPYEARNAREQALLQLLCVPGTGLSEAIPFILSFLTPSSSRPADPCAGAACILHTLSLLMISISLVGCGGDEDRGDAGGDSAAVSESLSLATSALVERVISLRDNARSSGGHDPDSRELSLLEQCGLIPPNSSSLSEITHFVDAAMDRLLEHALENHARACVMAGDASAEAAAKSSGLFARAARKQLRANSTGSVGRTVSRTVNRMTGKTEIIGLLARIVGTVVDTACNVDGLGDAKHRSSSDRQLTLPLDMLLHVESPLEKIKRAGLGFLTKGLSLWGGGGAVVRGSGRSINANGEPHPADYDTLVVFVIGGISYRELGQVREQLELYYSKEEGANTYTKKRMKVILGSTGILSAVDLLDSFIFG